MRKIFCKNCNKDFEGEKRRKFCSIRCSNLFNKQFPKGYIPWNSGRAKGLLGTSFYKAWTGMKDRCQNPKTPSYKGYGGRGITVCEEWQTFEGFYNDMFSSYQESLSIDRVDNNQGYYRENCRWATRKEQANNTRRIERAKKYFYKGIEDTTANWASFFKIKRTTLDMRLRRYGWNIERALFTAVKGGYNLE